MSVRSSELEQFEKQLLDLIAGRAEKIRPRLGDKVPLVVFRLYRYAVSKIAGGIEAVMYTLGKDIAKDIIAPHLRGDSLESLLREIGEILRRLDMGILEIDRSEEKVKIRIYECTTCYRLPKVDRPVCHFEGGIIAGALEGQLGEMIQVTETRCFGMGDEYCEFTIRPPKIEEKFFEVFRI